MPAIVGILMTGTLNSDIFTNSRFVPSHYSELSSLFVVRFIFAGARKSLMPTALALHNLEHNSPRVAIALHVSMTIPFN